MVPDSFYCSLPGQQRYPKVTELHGRLGNVERKGFQAPEGAARCAQHPVCTGTRLTSNPDLCRRARPYIPAVPPRDHAPQAQRCLRSPPHGCCHFCHRCRDGAGRAAFLPEAPVLAVFRLRLPFAALSRHLRGHRAGTRLREHHGVVVEGHRNARLPRQTRLLGLVSSHDVLLLLYLKRRHG